jgi:acetyl-CoA carboxylase alpha subunit
MDSIVTLKHNVRILAAKLSDLMIVDDLVADEVAQVRQDVEEATHKLEIALLAQF